MKQFLLSILFTLLASTAFAQVKTLDQAFTDKAKDAVALLYSQDQSGGMQMLCTMTAFEKVEKGYLFVSAAHCVGEDDTAHEKAASGKNKSFFVTHDELGMKRFYKATNLWTGYQHAGQDFSVFLVETKEDWPIVELGDETKEKEGNDFLNFASPLGLGVQTFSGKISKLILDRPLVEGDINWQGTMVLQMAGVNGGSSGSALISLSQHKIIGFLVGTVGGSSIIGIPVGRFEHVQQLVKDHKYKYLVDESDEK